jgi:hypothetical protein
MRTTVVAMVAVLGTLNGAAVQADPDQKREPSIRWLEDRFTETWSWVLRDAPVEIAGVTWTLDVQAQIRDHGQRLAEPPVYFTLTTPTPQAGYIACPDLGLIVNGEALQGIGLEWTFRQEEGRTMKSVTFKLSADRFRRIASAKMLEARLCANEFVFDPSLLASLRALGAKVRSGPPPAAERQRYRDATTAL